MGQKGNPKSVRLKINRDWEGVWFATKDYANYLIEDIRIREYIKDSILHKRQFAKLEISNIKIRRYSNYIDIIIFASRPGLLIGRKGADIEKLKLNLIKKIIKRKIALNININEIKNMDLRADVLSQVIGKMIEGRVAYKRAVKQALARSIKSGALGVKVKVAGRLGGADMARKEFFKEGSIPLHTFDAMIDYSHYGAVTTYGIIGISVWIYTGKKSKRKFKLEQVTTTRLS